MANTSYKNIQDNALALLGKSDTTTRNRVKEWINMGQDDFVLRELWPFREKTGTITTDGITQEYSLLGQFTDLDQQNIISVSVQGASGVKLTYIPFNQLRKNYPDFTTNTSGVSRYYYIKGGKIGFWPLPNTAITVYIDYYIIPTALSADADTSIIPSQYRQALNSFAISKEHDFNTDADLAVKEMNTYEAIVDKARHNLLVQPNDTGNFQIKGPADFTYWGNQFGDTR